MEQLPEAWRTFLAGEMDFPALTRTLAAVEEKRRQGEVFPPAGSVFRALESTPPDRVRVVILGQDPYHGKGEAHGLAFSVQEGVKPPPSLRNICRELASDLGEEAVPLSGFLARWAEAGVLLLNSVLSVDADSPGSHAGIGWERFTDGIIRALSSKREHLVFLLWGAYAQKKAELIDGMRHLVIESAHPSPLSARRGFFGSRPFSRAEAYLKDWRWPRFGADGKAGGSTQLELFQ